MNEIAAIQGQLRHLLRGDDLAERWIGCLNRHDVITRNCHGGDYGGGYERKVEFASFIDLKFQIFGFSALKSRGIDVYGVDPDRE